MSDDAHPEEHPAPSGEAERSENGTPENGTPEPDTLPDRGTEDTPGGGVPGPAFVVVGLGASAGGIEALEAFFAGLPEIDGIAFVVILHLAADEESRLAEVLQRDLPLPVTQVTEAVAVEPGHVYVIPPSKNLLIEDGHLVLEPIEAERVERRPVDHFLRTLADAYGEHAVGVILSGTGANGTVGARRLREVGGCVMAQDPEEARFEEMPRTAIAAGIVDVVGTAGRLAVEATAYAERLRTIKLPETPAALPEDGQKALQSVLAQLRARTGHDFAHYKRSTVLRRLDRRLHVTGADSLDAYLDHLRSDAREAAVLLDDLLISVTNFFRDKVAFAALEGLVPRLFEGKGPEDEVRVWVAGCATGEEAYSVAILLLEHAATLAEPPRLQVFATDLSEAAVREARAGVYPESIEADVSAERLRRFFTHDSGGYRVAEEVREAVIFAPHSLVKDPPFSRLDLVSCRNLLIYLQRDLQQQVLALFHYALRPGGLLFLGTSESADGGPDLFDLLDKGARLYRRLDVETPAPFLPHVPRVLTEPPVLPAAPPLAVPEPPPDEFARLHQALREETAPPSVLVNEAGEVVHVSDDAAPFLQVSGGAPTRSLVKLLRPELRASVQTALFQARRDGAPATSGPVTLTVGGEARRVGVRARPTTPPGGTVQVVFDAHPAAETRSAAATGHDADLVAVLEEELGGAREQVRVSNEEFETSREELRSQNEELQSVNEELRSTAEELETSKEEAQSMAEELRTVNDELKAKVEETARAKGDLENLIVSTEIATLFLDRELRIKRFTPHVRDHFHVLASDVGRPLEDLAQKFGGVRLAEDAEAVVERLEVKEREVEGADGRWYLVHARPYRTAEDRIAGVVITFVDITRRKADEAALAASADRAAFRAALTDAFREHADPVAVQAQATRLLGQHLGASRVHYAEVEPDGRHAVVARDYARTAPDRSGRYALADFSFLVADARAGRTVVVSDIATDDRLSPAEKEQYAGLPVAALVVVPLVKDGRLVALFAVHHDAPRDWADAEVALVEETAERTWAAVERARAEDALRQSEERLRRVVEAVPDLLFTATPEGTIDYTSSPVDADTDALPLDLEGWLAFVHPDDREHAEAAWREAVEHGRPYESRHRVRQPDGSYRWFIVRARLAPAAGGAEAAWYGTATDIDALVRAEAEVRELNRTLGDRVEERTGEVRALSARLTVAEQEERQRIAQVLHDDLQQQLFGLGLILSLVRKARSDEEAEELFGQIEETHDQATELTRSLVVELSPPVLESERLEEILMWLALRKEEEHGMVVDVEVEEPCEVPARPTRVLLYQVLRELLFNVVKHAGTRHARLRARREGDVVTVEVGDDGDGFDPDALKDRPRADGGFGLASVRERVEQVGGHVEITSAPGDGTRVTIRVLATEPDDAGDQAA